MLTDRCILYPLTIDDRKDIEALYSDEDTRKFLGGTTSTSAFPEKFASILNEKDAYHWVAKAQHDKQFIGLFSLAPHHDGNRMELSYQLISSAFGKGYASEILPFLTRFAFIDLDLPIIVAETQSQNIASVKLLTKAGFQLEEEFERFGALQSLYTLSNSGH